MRVLILGATGMLGHKVSQVLRGQFETWTTFRKPPRQEIAAALYEPAMMITGLDVLDRPALERTIHRVKPDAVVNCVGIIKQVAAASDPIATLNINSLLPHQLGQMCEAAGARLVHISTDCVFSGRRGNYTEDDQSDAEDLYGRTKFLGEVTTGQGLTLRTSIIGRELGTTDGLVEWFLSNRGKAVNGFTEAKFSGLTTEALARLIALVLDRRPALLGLYHVSADPISKYDLLNLLDKAFHADVSIAPSAGLVIDRTLDSRRLRSATGWSPDGWPEMVRRMAGDTTPYEEWRRRNAS